MAFEPTPSWALNIDWTGAATQRHASAERFRLEVPIGVGGAADVWRAHDPVSGRDVAIKVLAPDLARDPVFQEELRREVRLAARLRHPNIVRILDVGTLGPEAERATSGRLVAGSPFVAMELMQGTLRGHVPSNAAAFVRLADGLLRGLAHSHAHEVLHLDLKPANILLDAGRVALADFGIARRIEETLRAPEGTPAYRAPEQSTGDGRHVGPRSDLFALGLVLWELVTGSLPYADLSPAQLLFAKPPALDPRFALAPHLEVWLRRMVATAPDARFASAAAARAGLHQESLQLPASWPEVEGVPLDFGAGIWSLQDPPWIHRDEVCAALWSHATHVAEGAGRHLSIGGDPGSGRTRLVEELAAALAETGVFARARAESREELETVSLTMARPCVVLVDGCADVPATPGMLALQTTDGPGDLRVDFFGGAERAVLFDRLRLDPSAREALGHVAAPGPALMQVAAVAQRGGWVRRGDELTLDASLVADPAEASVDGLCGRLAEHEIRALEVAAVLGPTERSVWRRAARSLDLAPTWISVDRAVADGVARLEGRRLVLRSDVAATLRERAGSRRRGIHEACVAALRAEPTARRRDERLARHLEAFGDREQARQHWLAAAEARLRALDERGARAALDALEALDASSDAEEVRRSLIVSRLARLQGDMNEAEKAAIVAHRRAREAGDDGLLAAAAHQRGRLLRAAGDEMKALTLFHQAERAAKRAGQGGLVAEALIDRASVLTAQGSYEAAHEALAKARDAHPDARGRAWCGVLYGRALRRAGRWADAKAVLRAAHATLATKRRGLIPEAELELGRVARSEGLLDEAEEELEAALRGFVALGSRRAIDAERELGLVLVDRGDFVRAHTHLLGAHRALEARDPSRAREWKLALAWLHARAGDEEAAGRELMHCRVGEDPEWKSLHEIFVKRASEALRARLERLTPAE